jgi:hypothetical protein
MLTAAALRRAPRSLRLELVFNRLRNDCDGGNMGRSLEELIAATRWHVADANNDALSVVTGFNVVHKRPEHLARCVEACRELRRVFGPTPDVCAHFSVKHTRALAHVSSDSASRARGDSSLFALRRTVLDEFLRYREAVSAAGGSQLLVVSGSGLHDDSLKSPALLRHVHDVDRQSTSVDVANSDAASPHRLRLGVAFNPYAGGADDVTAHTQALRSAFRDRESEALRAKLRAHPAVRSIWLQIGTDTDALRRGFETINDAVAEAKSFHASSCRPSSSAAADHYTVFGGVFVPSRKWRAVMRRGAWAGVHLSAAYLDDDAAANAITAETLRLFREHCVTPIVESLVTTSADVVAARRMVAAGRYDDNEFES